MINEYTYRIDHIAQGITEDIRTEITNRIREAINKNQDTFLAHWLLQNPDVDLSKAILNHGFKGTCYQFWVSEEE